ncbi:MAG: hypothetical protein ACOCP8_09570 [archaeon]
MFENGKCYLYEKIEDYIKKYNLQLEEYGNFIIDQHFLQFKDKDKNVYNFILNGYSNQGIYKKIVN